MINQGHTRELVLQGIKQALQGPCGDFRPLPYQLPWVDATDENGYERANTFVVSVVKEPYKEYKCSSQTIPKMKRF